jgi:hypothetical protein
MFFRKANANICLLHNPPSLHNYCHGVKQSQEHNVVVGDQTLGHLKSLLALFREFITKGQTLKGSCSWPRDGKSVKHFCKP